jgi:hypothetical protein
MVKYVVLNKTQLKCVYEYGNAQLTNRITLNTQVRVCDGQRLTATCLPRRDSRNAPSALSSRLHCSRR